MNVQTKHIPATDQGGEFIEVTTDKYKGMTLRAAWNYKDSQRNNHDNAISLVVAGRFIVKSAVSTGEGFKYEIEVLS